MMPDKYVPSHEVPSFKECTSVLYVFTHYLLYSVQLRERKKGPQSAISNSQLKSLQLTILPQSLYHDATS